MKRTIGTVTLRNENKNEICHGMTMCIAPVFGDMFCNLLYNGDNVKAGMTKASNCASASFRWVGVFRRSRDRIGRNLVGYTLIAVRLLALLLYREFAFLSILIQDLSQTAPESERLLEQSAGR